MLASSADRARYSGHVKHKRFCSCGKVVRGNGGKRHFELDGHRRITSELWRARFGEVPE